MLTWLKSQFVCQEWKLYTDARPEFSKGRVSFLEQGRFDKRLIYDARKKAPQFFLLSTLKMAF